MPYGHTERARSGMKNRRKKTFVISSQIDVCFHSAYLCSTAPPVTRTDFFNRNEGEHLNAAVLDIKMSVAPGSCVLLV